MAPCRTKANYEFLEIDQDPWGPGEEPGAKRLHAETMRKHEGSTKHINPIQHEDPWRGMMATYGNYGSWQIMTACFFSCVNMSQRWSKISQRCSGGALGLWLCFGYASVMVYIFSSNSACWSGWAAMALWAYSVHLSSRGPFPKMWRRRSPSHAKRSTMRMQCWTQVWSLRHSGFLGANHLSHFITFLCIINCYSSLVAAGSYTTKLIV